MSQQFPKALVRKNQKCDFYYDSENLVVSAQKIQESFVKVASSKLQFNISEETTYMCIEGKQAKRISLHSEDLDFTTYI